MVLLALFMSVLRNRICSTVIRALRRMMDESVYPDNPLPRRQVMRPYPGALTMPTFET